MACFGTGMATDQNVPVQADQHQQRARPDQPADGGRRYIRADEIITRTAAHKMGQPSTG